MRTLRTVPELRAALAGPRRDGRTIGLVPTMGALHEGHESLIGQAALTCDEVVVSLFVNPTQFDQATDLDAYPRDEARDAELAAGAGADLLFAPAADVVYPRGFATTIRVTGVTEPLEGAHRGAAHFDGVATVVCKLLNMAGADVAFFGAKDAQQVAVVRRMVADLDIPTRIDVVDTVRDDDGLALSSRNARLEAADRSRALALRAGLDGVRDAAASGVTDASAAIAAGVDRMLARGVEPEYLALVDPDTFASVITLNGNAVLVAVAARVGDVRLIDNELLSPTAEPQETS